VDRALIDGEAVVRQVDGRSNFEALMTKRGGAQASLVACRRLMTIAGVGQLTALADPATSAPIWAWSPGGISLARSTTPAASRNAGTGAREPSCTRPLTSW
jgi:hypothetical protein